MTAQKRIDLTKSELGRGEPLFSWDARSTRLAVYGTNGKVRIMSPDGKTLHTFSLTNVLDLGWDPVRGILALIQDNSGEITLCSVESRNTQHIDSGLHNLTFLSWSPQGSLLAVGSEKGAFVILNGETQHKAPIVGTHTKKIIEGKWTSDNLLLMIGEDGILSVSESDGTLQRQLQLNSVPIFFTVAEVVGRSADQGFKTIALVSLGKVLEYYNVDLDKSYTVPLEANMGSITACHILPDGITCIGLSSGSVALASVHGNGMKLYGASRPFKSSVQGLSCSHGSGICAAVGDFIIKFFTMGDNKFAEIKSSAITLDSSIGSIKMVRWSNDGSNLTLSTEKGNLLSYTLSVSAVSTFFGSYVIFLTGSRTVSVKNLHDGRVLYSVHIDIDATILAAGKGVLAACTRNTVMFYSLQSENQSKAEKKESGLINSVEYPSVVSAVKVSAKHAAVLYDGKVQLHSIRPGGNSMVIPESGNASIISVGISEVLLTYATSEKICVVNLNDYQCVVEHSPTTGIKKAISNPTCTRIAIVDKNDALFIFNPITLVATQVEGYEADQKGFLWDQGDYGVLISYSSSSIVTYVYAPHSRYGPTCESVLVKGTTAENLLTSIPPGCNPVCLFKGVVTLQTTSGSLDTLTLNSHRNTLSRSPDSEAFYYNFSLNHLRWASQNISTPQEAEDLAVKALHMLDIELAIRLYRQLSQPSLVMCLEGIRHINEKNLLIGHISMIMGFFKDAQTFFLRSSQPLCALEMRHDLMQWDPALALAKQMAPEKVPILSKEYALQLEYRGDYAKALEMYRAGERPIPKGHSSTELLAEQQEVKKHNDICLKGAARSLIRINNINDGIKLALESDDPTLLTECAEILESLRKYEEAANMYEKASDFERAATLYIMEAKNLKAASRIISKITSRNIIGMFAKGKENEGSFQEAEQAYTLAEDWDNVVRIKVEKLNDLHGAYVIVRRTRSAAAASVVANICKKNGEFGSAVEFFILSKNFQQAFELAKDKNLMSKLESALLGQVQLNDGVAPQSSQSDFALIGQYYEQNNKPGQAGLFYHIAGNFSFALKNYLEAGEPEDIEKAIQVVGKSRNDTLTNRLIDYLMGESDGDPKEPAYIFKLYMALGSFEKAGKTSVLISTKEQEIGSYRAAHKTLLEAYCMLREKKMRVPSDLRRSLMLLHSYMIVKHLIKPMRDDETATRMLLRVVRNIQKFPKHIATIYTSTALQCLKSGFKKSAFDNACAIIQNQKYRTEVDDKNRKKIEGIVRRRGKEEMEDPPEKNSPCPFCDAQIPETELDCGSCKNTLPFCIVTGKHIVKENYAVCPNCQFPALYSSFMALLRETQVCPMCEGIVDLNKVLKQTDPDMKPYIA